jgi:carbamoyl-phosphate synthase large subunit
VKNKPRVLIAGIGGASLGTEILKCLTLAGRYLVFGCDISSFAYGHYQNGLERTFLVERGNYVESVLEICRASAIDVIVPGGEEPMVLLSEASEQLATAGIRLAGNSQPVIKRFSDKQTTFRILAELGFPTPLTITAGTPGDLKDMSYPCIVKPATGTGGSSFVFLAEDRDEALLYVGYLLKNGKAPIVQEYIAADEGEFTIGVLSLPDGRVAGSVALKRILDAKLSVLSKTKAGVISSGYSQGLIDDFPDLRAEAERIALAIHSQGPLNIQGRVRSGKLIPFEINPRFSASTYLRALAGFNEVDVYLQRVINGVPISPAALKAGYYLRSFEEVFVSKDKVVS